MKAITTRGLIRTVAERWGRQQIGTRGGVFTPPPAGQNVAYDALAALDPETATAEDVAAITGNTSWVAVTCGECGRSVDRAVQLGEEPGDDSATVLVCRGCLVGALALLDETP